MSSATMLPVYLSKTSISYLSTITNMCYFLFILYFSCSPSSATCCQRLNDMLHNILLLQLHSYDSQVQLSLVLAKTNFSSNETLARVSSFKSWQEVYLRPIGKHKCFLPKVLKSKKYVLNLRKYLMNIKLKKKST